MSIHASLYQVGYVEIYANVSQTYQRKIRHYVTKDYYPDEDDFLPAPGEAINEHIGMYFQYFLFIPYLLRLALMPILSSHIKHTCIYHCYPHRL